MSAKNILLKSLSRDKSALLIALDATDAINYSLSLNEANPPAMMLLGRAMMATLLVQSLSDFDDPDKVEMYWNTPGPFGEVFSEATGLGIFRGTIAFPKAEILDLKCGLGPGLLQVRRRRISQTQAPAYTGIINAEGDISLDLLNYLESSEQKQCGSQLFVEVKIQDQRFVVEKALAYLVHVLPVDNILQFEAILADWDTHLQNLGALSKWDLSNENAEARCTDMLRFLSGETNPNISGSFPIKFECHCDIDRAERAMALASRDEAFAPGSTVEIRCEFCGKKYNLSAGSTTSN